MTNGQDIGRVLHFAQDRRQVAEKARRVIAQMKAWEEEKALRAFIDQVQNEVNA